MLPQITMDNNFVRTQKQEPFHESSMIRAFSEYDFEELFKQSIGIDDDHRNHPPAGGMFGAPDSVVFGNDDRKHHAGDVALQYRNPGNLNRFSSGGEMGDNPLWSQNLTPKSSCVTVTIDSQSSICADSPASDTKPNQWNSNPIGTSSENEQSDDDPEIETGQCEQSNDKVDVKKIKRMVSNRESARRSRKRKQAHLTDLEQQVEQLRAEYAALFKQLTDATHNYKDASTNNRVLKSEVEALRANVKLAEDTLARGPLTSSLSHLLQNHLITPQLFNCQNISRMVNVSPTITVRGDDHGPHAGLPIPGQHMMSGLGTDPDIFNGITSSGGGSCVTDIWSSQDANSTV